MNKAFLPKIHRASSRNVLKFVVLEKALFSATLHPLSPRSTVSSALCCSPLFSPNVWIFPSFLPGKFHLRTGPFGIAQEYSEGEGEAETKFRKLAHITLACSIVHLLECFSAAFVWYQSAGSCGHVKSALVEKWQNRSQLVWEPCVHTRL